MQTTSIFKKRTATYNAAINRIEKIRICGYPVRNNVKSTIIMPQESEKSSHGTVMSKVSPKNAPCVGSSQKKILRSRCFILACHSFERKNARKTHGSRALFVQQGLQ
mgnify:CR=1 FL=1